MNEKCAAIFVIVKRKGKKYYGGEKNAFSVKGQGHTLFISSLFFPTLNLIQYLACCQLHAWVGAWWKGAEEAVQWQVSPLFIIAQVWLSLTQPLIFKWAWKALGSNPTCLFAVWCPFLTLCAEAKLNFFEKCLGIRAEHAGIYSASLLHMTLHINIQ